MGLPSHIRNRKQPTRPTDLVRTVLRGPGRGREGQAEGPFEAQIRGFSRGFWAVAINSAGRRSTSFHRRITWEMEHGHLKTSFLHKTVFLRFHGNIPVETYFHNTFYCHHCPLLIRFYSQVALYSAGHPCQLQSAKSSFQCPFCKSILCDQPVRLGLGARVLFVFR